MGLTSNVVDTINRWRLAARAGLSFGGARDLYQVFGYKRNLMHEDFIAKYLRQDIAKRVVHAPVDAVWSEPPTLKGSARFTTAWERLLEDFNPFPYLSKTDVFAGLGSFAICVIGFDDKRRLSEPVDPSRTSKIIYMQPYLEGSVQITAFDEDETSPRFGQPLIYEVSPGELTMQRLSASTKIMLRKKFTVHWSRVLHVAEGTLENNVFGHSRLESVYNVLDDLMKVCGGSAETFWLAGNRGMQVDIDKDVEMEDTDANDLAEEIDEYQHQLRRVIRTRGVKITNLGSDVADPKNTFNVLMSMLSASTGIPQRVLMGAEAGQLASQQDRANWADRVNERIANFAEPIVLKTFIDLIVAAGLLPVKHTEVKWAEAFKLNPLEKAQTTAQMGRTAVNVARALETSQKTMTDLMSVEEAREIIAPGVKMPTFEGLPKGTMLESIEKVDPNKFLPPQPVQADPNTAPTPTAN